MKDIFEMMCPAALNLSSSFVGSLGKCDWETDESMVLRTMTFDYASVKNWFNKIFEWLGDVALENM